MSKDKLHWMDREKDPNVRQTKIYVAHINRPRISGETIVRLLTLKSELTGTKLDILKEAEAFEECNSAPRFKMSNLRLYK